MLKCIVFSSEKYSGLSFKKNRVNPQVQSRLTRKRQKRIRNRPEPCCQGNKFALTDPTRSDPNCGSIRVRVKSDRPMSIRMVAVFNKLFTTRNMQKAS